MGLIEALLSTDQKKAVGFPFCVPWLRGSEDRGAKRACLEGFFVLLIIKFSSPRNRRHRLVTTKKRIVFGKLLTIHGRPLFLPPKNFVMGLRTDGVTRLRRGMREGHVS